MTSEQSLRTKISDAITNLQLHKAANLDDKTSSMLIELDNHLFELTMKEGIEELLESTW